jgi:carboxylesterase type B
VALILAFTFLGTTKQTRVAPIRNGKVLTSTSCGLVEGLVEDSAVAFRGIPYAKPPINKLRFEPAEVIDEIQYCWNGTLKAHNSSVECLQVSNGVVTGEENCLLLDIITPEVRYINLLPVVVMIGANDYFGGSPGMNPSTRFSCIVFSLLFLGILRPSARYARSRDVVFVRPRFRVNVFGFLSLESISNSSNVPSSGNYALTDIIAALKWYKLFRFLLKTLLNSLNFRIEINIHNFGGDPKSVTLFGHRTGAT